MYNNRVLVVRIIVEDDFGDPGEDAMENEIPPVKTTASKMITVLCLVLLLTTVGLAGCNRLPDLSFSPQL